jgi:YD repeat-containing protein
VRVAPRGGRSPFAIVASLAIALLLLCGAAGAATIQYVYDELGRLVGVIDPAGDTTRYTYDEAGNLTSVARNASSQLAIVSFTPAHGPVGTRVTIFGTGFGATPAQNTVRFNGTPATVTSASPTTLVATVPAGATTGPISVTAPLGNVTSATAFTVIVQQPPQITALTPAIVAAGVAFTVSGSAFEPVPTDNQARINIATAAVLAATETALTVRAPAVTGGKVGVTTANGSATSSADLFIVPAPNAAADVGATARIAIDAAGAPLSLPASKMGLALFDGTAGTVGVKLTASGVTLPNGGTLTAYAPNGSVFGNPASFGTAGATLSLPALTATGSYGVRVTSNSGAGNLTLGVWKDISGTLAPGGSTDLSFTNPGQVARISFTAAIGDILGVDLSSVTLPAGAELLVLRDADGAQLINTSVPAGSAGASVRMAPISQAGSYTIIVSPTGSGTGSLHLTLWRDVGGTLTVGTTNNITVAFRNQFVRMRFSATQGQNLGVDIASLTGFTSGGLLVTRDSDGAQLVNTSFNTAAGIGARIPTISQAGNYTVIASFASNATGTLQLTLWGDVDDALSVGTPFALSLSYRNQSSRQPFTGTAGQNLGVDITPGTLVSGGSLLVQRVSDGAQLVNTSIPAGTLGGSVRIPPLAVSGAYTVIFSPNGGATGTATLTLWRDVPGTLAVGELNNVTIAYRNQNARPGFAGVAGQNLGLDLSSLSGFTSGQVSVIREFDGASIVNSASFSSAQGIGVRIPPLSQTGNYTVWVAPAANSTGSFNLRLWKDVDDALSIDGAAYPLSLAYRNQQARLPFTGASGDRLAVELSGVTLPGGGVLNVIRGSDGAFLVNSASFGAAGGTFTIPDLSVAGPYTVNIVPNSAGTGTMNVRVFRR